MSLYSLHPIMSHLISDLTFTFHICFSFQLTLKKELFLPLSRKRLRGYLSAPNFRNAITRSLNTINSLMKGLFTCKI